MNYKKINKIYSSSFIADDKREKSFEDIVQDVKRFAKRLGVEYVLETSTDKFFVDLDNGDNRANRFLIDLQEKYEDTGILKVSYKDYEDERGKGRCKITFKAKK